MMNKKDRVDAAIRGQQVDVIPFSVWWHMGTQILSGSDAADMHLTLAKECDVDFVKLMNDYPYPVPDAFDAVRSVEDWKKMSDRHQADTLFSPQRELIDIVCRRTGDMMHVIETVFNPFGTARRVGKDRIFSIMREHPDIFLRGMDGITESLEGYVRDVVRRGVTGIFFAVYGAGPFFSSDKSFSDKLSVEEFRKYVKPYDLRLLRAIREQGVLTMLHIHGDDLLFEEILDYPVDVLNWSHFHSAPSLGQARKKTSCCLMGGINESTTNMYHPDVVVEWIRSAVDEAGATSFMYGPGCALPTDLPLDYVHLMRKTIRELGTR